MNDGLDRLSLNQITTKGWNLLEAVEGCQRAGITSIGLWRDKVQEVGIDAAVTALRRAGMQVSSLCRAGFFPSEGLEEFEARITDGQSAIEEAARLGTDVLVLVCGGISGEGLEASRASVAEGIEALLPAAEREGVRLAIEPLHPMYCADRSVIVTLDQAVSLAERFPLAQVGVVVDTFHVWWDPELEAQIARAGAEGRLASYQVCDFNLPIAADALLSRGMMGDGVIDFATIGRWVAAAGYTGPVEVEIFNQEIWDTPGDEVLRTISERYVRHVLPALGAAGS